MSIQRQYSLPNCTLMLEGWGNELPLGDTSTTRPVLSMLTLATCLFTGQEKPLAGGREFFESLIACASLYAQEFLSGVPHGNPRDRAAEPSVELTPLSANMHRLTVRPQSFQDDPIKKSNVTPIALDLTTVHLFDLVEAIDQFYADTQTLPELSPNFTPAPKRNVVASEPIAQRMVPAALGISGLAVAAIAFFFIPVPAPREPEPAATNAVNSTEVTPNNPAAGNSPNSDSNAAADFQNPQTSEQINALLDTAPEIRDPAVLDAMAVNLDETLRTAWGQDVSFSDDLVYRVGVAENGDILGFKAENDAALTAVNETPLRQLLYTPVDPEAPVNEPIGQFQVTFTPEGTVEVIPWRYLGAIAPTSSATPRSTQTTTALGPKITDSAELERLNSILYRQVLEALPRDPDFADQWEDDLVYKVHFTPDGDVVAFEPADTEAERHATYLGLPELVNASPALADREQGEFMVVVTENGVLQVNPWDGW
jgi:hypothetical protein